MASHSVEEHKIISEEQTCKLVYISNCTDAEFRMYNGQTVRSGKLVRHGFQEDCLSFRDMISLTPHKFPPGFVLDGGFIE